VLADLGHAGFFGVAGRHVDLLAVRLGADVGDQGLDVGIRPGFENQFLVTSSSLKPCRLTMQCTTRDSASITFLVSAK
jgi:hypothetical protein